MKSPTEFRNQQLQQQISEQKKHGNVAKIIPKICNWATYIVSITLTVRGQLRSFSQAKQK